MNGFPGSSSPCPDDMIPLHYSSHSFLHAEVLALLKIARAAFYTSTTTTLPLSLSAVRVVYAQVAAVETIVEKVSVQSEETMLFLAS